MRNNNNLTKDLNIQISILNDNNMQVKSFTISVDDYTEQTIGKKCQNLADDIITNMLKNIIQEKQLLKI